MVEKPVPHVAPEVAVTPEALAAMVDDAAPAPAVVIPGPDVRHDVALTLLASNEIKSYVVAAVALSAVPLPLVDVAGIAAIQLRMIQKLSQLYGKPFSSSLGSSLQGALLGTFGGLGGGLAVGSLVKIVPGIGWALSAATMPIAAGASTYAIGRVFVRHYEEGGSLFNLDAGKFKAFAREQYEKGKQLARIAKREAKEAKDAAAA
ncbi:DUF697 domain-containing protein [Niveispirillum sp. SYP-B3756]|uniref:DUF697 domain-containing protein n=1 Tax=Niveispirillum sp. SYP-B3756 TaxID=2662178 RepID=UPI0012916C3F|nr:DUF697 domain-containing protein [Niveispirillum sp. SYP-B3756]MQP66434.1 DUF697 domain-containing protein [Niveispirillum sp. SYP-B3756]